MRRLQREFQFQRHEDDYSSVATYRWEDILNALIGFLFKSNNPRVMLGEEVFSFSGGNIVIADDSIFRRDIEKSQMGKAYEPCRESLIRLSHSSST